MRRLGKICCFVIFIFIGGANLSAKESEPFDYTRYVDDIVNDFARDMKKEFGLHCCGSGGSMPYDVERIQVMFSTYHKSSIDDVRKVIVSGVTKLLQQINAHEKIRPFLREYPFDTNRVSVSISFSEETGERPLDGSVAHIFASRGKVYYDKAEVIIREPIPFICSDENNMIVRVSGGGPRVTLLPLMEETFEEALEVVQRDRKSKDS